MPQVAAVTRETRTLPSPLQAFLFAAVGATCLAVLVSLGRMLLLREPFGAYGLWPPSWSFDFLCYYPRYLSRHSVDFFTRPGFAWYYPAPAIFLYYPFYGFAHRIHSLERAYFVYVGLLVAEALALACLLGWRLRREGLTPGQASLYALGALLTAWPLYFAAQRGNIEGIAWLITALALWAYASGRPVWAAVLLGFAGSVKPYPLLFAALFLRQRRWFALLVMTVVLIVSTLAGLRFLEPSVRDSYLRVAHGIREFTKVYSEVYLDPEWDHSSFALYKDLVHPGVEQLHQAIRIYYVVAGGSGLTLYLLRIRHLPIANELLFLSCAATALPPTSFEYTLCLLYLPFAWLSFLGVRYALQGLRVRGLALTLFVLGLSLAPTAYGYTHTFPQVEGVLKGLFLLACLACACFFPFPESAPAESSELTLAS